MLHRMLHRMLHHRYIQVADAILLFSVCASYGVAAGLYFSARNGDKVKTA